MSDIVMERAAVHFPVRGGWVKAVDGISGCFLSGEITGIIGESGCGKSVLGMSLIGLLPAYARVSGKIWLGDQELLSMNPKAMRQFRGRTIGLIAQNPADSLNPVRRVKNQLTEAIRVDPAAGRGHHDHAAAVWELLSKFGFTKAELPRVLHSYPFQLSGGMQQRVAAAMGIASGASWILADEPSKGLDERLREQMYETLRQVREQGTEGMVIITHDLVLAEQLCDSVAVMYSGQIVEKGRTVLQNPRHPYTRGLLNSLPARGMKPMRGMAPAPGEVICGCKFAARCDEAEAKCFVSCPEEYGDEKEMVRCFQYDRA